MRQDSRLSRMLHVLIHMGRHDGAMTSDVIAQMLDANPVVIRRTMAGLRDQGYVSSVKGHGGGWTLARPLEELTLLDVYRAVGEPSIFAVGPAYDMPGCLIEQAVNGTLKDVFCEADKLLRKRFAEMTLADVAKSFTKISESTGSARCGSRLLTHEMASGPSAEHRSALGAKTSKLIALSIHPKLASSRFKQNEQVDQQACIIGPQTDSTKPS